MLKVGGGQAGTTTWLGVGYKKKKRINGIRRLLVHFEASGAKVEESERVRESERGEGEVTLGQVVPPSFSQKEGVGGSGGLCAGLGWHAHQGLGHGHGSRDPRTHPRVRPHAYPHPGHHAAHGGHACQGDHGDGLSGHGGEGHGLGHEACGHRADPHLVEGGRRWLAHLEGVGVGCWSRACRGCTETIKKEMLPSTHTHISTHEVTFNVLLYHRWVCVQACVCVSASHGLLTTLPG